MVRFHAVLLDETRCEFGAGVEAETREAAYAQLAEDYPESRVIQLESPDDTARRERDIQRFVERQYDDDDPRWED